MKLVVTLEKPVNGWWDGGAKSRFEFTIDGRPQKDSKGEFVKIGSWGANTWFNVAVGKTDKQTLSNAARHVKAGFKKRGLAATFTYAD